MRYVKLAVMVLAAGLVTPALATNEHAVSGPNWNDCYGLAWIRGVHVEQGELPDFMAQCLAGSVPFGEDFEKYTKEMSR